MNFRLRVSPRAATLLVAAFGATAPLMTSVAQARSAPKQELQIWPGRRVLLVLPVTPSANWNSDPALGRAIVPLAQPELQRALEATGKFSITLPYRFDPVLRRALAEKQVAENDVTALLQSSTLETSRPVVDKLQFDQPVMTADVQLESLTIGGTPEVPTVQIQASGKLYEQGNPSAVKSIVVTSPPFPGKTPAIRLAAAAAEAFREIAAEFVQPPPAFALPAPIVKAVVPAPGATSGATSGATGSGSSSAMAPAAPTMPEAPPASIAEPNPLAPAAGVPFIPQLPASQPPLGVGAGANTNAQ